MAAVVHVQTHVVLLRDLLSSRTEHAHICATETVDALFQEDRRVGLPEPVDALLGVAHRGEMACAVTRQKRDELELPCIGVLRLVDHHKPEAPTVVCRNNGVVTHSMEGKRDKVVVVEDGLLALELKIALVYLAGKANKGLCQRRIACKCGLEPGLAQGALCLGHKLLYRLCPCAGKLYPGKRRGGRFRRSLARRR